MSLKYKRVLLKLSGEALSAPDCILDGEFMTKVCSAIKDCADMGAEIAIVIGGGNIWRGRQGINIQRPRSDGMGMLATLINSIAVQDTLIKCGLDTHVLSPLSVQRLAEDYSPQLAKDYLSGGSAVILSCGTGNPYFSTDTGAMLRALEIEADIVLCAKNIDGVYDSDPKLNPNAKKYSSLSYNEVIEKDLKAIDGTAACMGGENGMKMLVFALKDPDNIRRALIGEDVGTVIHP
ncbi:MAG: UMP kinase [Clostridia bacterium]|nr:UMP kinase [Clostridia bacterium]